MSNLLLKKDEHWKINEILWKGYLHEYGPNGVIFSFFGMFTVVVSFSLRENLFRWMTRIFGKRYTVISFSILSTALHLLHLYPHFSIVSFATKSLRQSATSTPPIDLAGIDRDKSIKLSKVRLWKPHFRHSILLQSWPSNKSVIIELSLSWKYWCQTSDYCNISNFSQSICLYFGFFFTLFSSLCIPSSMNLRNSWASCWP